MNKNTRHKLHVCIWLIIVVMFFIITITSTETSSRTFYENGYYINITPVLPPVILIFSIAILFNLLIRKEKRSNKRLNKQSNYQEETQKKEILNPYRSTKIENSKFSKPMIENVNSFNNDNNKIHDHKYCVYCGEKLGSDIKVCPMCLNLVNI